MISTTHYEHILKKDVWHELEIKSVLKADSSIYDLLRAAIAAKTLTPICTVQISEDGASVYGFRTTDVIEWARTKGYQIPDELEAINSMNKAETLGEDNASNQATTKPYDSASPWQIADPADPEPKQPWYTPARYFARQLVKEDSTLLTKRDLLTNKVAQSLTNVGIKKRGGKAPLDSATIKKALSKVLLR